MDLSNYYDAFWYAGATLVAYYGADIGVCKGCIRADGWVKDFLVGLAAAFFQRAIFLVARGRRVNWEHEAYYWRSVALGIGVCVAFNACVGYLRRMKERARVPPPAPARGSGRRRRAGRRA